MDETFFVEIFFLFVFAIEESVGRTRKTRSTRLSSWRMIDLKKVAKSKRWDAQFRNRKKERKKGRKKERFFLIV